MARPERHDVDYFPFIAKRGKTLNILQSRYGLEGIGFFTNLLRFLAATPDHYYCIKEELDMLNFFAETGLPDTEKGIAMIEMMVKTEKLDRDLWESHRVIVCPAFLDSIKDAYDRRSNPIITLEEIRAKFQNTVNGVIVSENIENTATSGVIVSEMTTETPRNGFFDDNNPQTKLKESKVKETKNSCGSSEPPQSEPIFEPVEKIERLDFPNSRPFSSGVSQENAEPSPIESSANCGGTLIPKTKKPPLRDREPENDHERVEKAYTANRDRLFSQGRIKVRNPPPSAWGQSRKLLSQLFAAEFTAGQIVEAVNRALTDGFVLQNGYSLPNILSGGVLDRLLNGSTGPPPGHGNSPPPNLAGKPSLGDILDD